MHKKGASKGAFFTEPLIVPTLQRGNAARDALRHNGVRLTQVLKVERGASLEAFPRGAWERS
ncbi:DUF1534 domain-containing protein [Pseudomonas sp. H3(2019)]|nr:DUF1534 domain-containing protein [Pseudomonas sp. H3(2019)]